MFRSAKIGLHIPEVFCVIKQNEEFVYFIKITKTAYAIRHVYGIKSTILLKLIIPRVKLVIQKLYMPV